MIEEETLDNALVELEKIGWPCRLAELPAKYDDVCRKLAVMTAAKDRAVEALRSTVFMLRGAGRPGQAMDISKIIAALEEVKP